MIAGRDTLIGRLRRAVYLDVKVSEVVVVGYGIDARNANGCMSVIRQVYGQIAVECLRLGHQPLRLLDDSLGESHDGVLVCYSGWGTIPEFQGLQGLDLPWWQIWAESLCQTKNFGRRLGV